MDTSQRDIQTLALVGYGRMGSAIVDALLDTDCMRAQNIFVCGHNVDQLKALSTRGVCVADDLSQLNINEVDAVLLAIKPQSFEKFLSKHAEVLKDKLVISIAAGVSIASLQNALGAQARVVRVMPNLLATIQKSANLLSISDSVSASDAEFVRSLFSACGSAHFIDEAKMDAASVLNGCSPAFFASIIDSFCVEAVSLGVSAPLARQLLLQTMQGTAELLLQTNEHPKEFTEKVCSPSGTTIEGVKVINHNVEILEEIIHASYKRSKELAQTGE